MGPNAGKILIAGGAQNNRTTLASTELYDPITNAFEPGPTMLTARTQHIAMVIKSGPNAGKILIAAGLVNDSGNDVATTARYSTTPLAATELYDPISNRFIPGPPMRGAPGKAVAVQLP